MYMFVFFSQLSVSELSTSQVRGQRSWAKRRVGILGAGMRMGDRVEDGGMVGVGEQAGSYISSSNSMRN